VKSGIRSHRYVLPLYTFAKEEILIIAYSHPYVNEVESGLAHGCSPWGASTIAGSKGERVPTGGELEVAVHQGKVSNILYLKYYKLIIDVCRVCWYLRERQAGLDQLRFVEMANSKQCLPLCK
jgi:hypothetical protein